MNKKIDNIDNKVDSLLLHGANIFLSIIGTYLAFTCYRTVFALATNLPSIQALTTLVTAATWLYLHNLHNPGTWPSYLSQTSLPRLSSYTLAFASLVTLLISPLLTVGVILQNFLVAGIGLHAWLHSNRVFFKDSATLAPIKKLSEADMHAGPVNSRLVVSSNLIYRLPNKNKSMTPSRSVAMKVHANFKHFSHLFCQLHSINPKIPHSSRVIEDYVLLKDLSSNDIYYVDANRYATWRHLLPEHIYPVQGQIDTLATLQQSALVTIDQRLNDLLSMHHFIQLSHYHKNNVASPSVSTGDPFRTPEHNKSYSLKSIHQQSSLYTPSPSKFDQATYQDQVISPKKPLGFKITLTNSDGQEKLIITDSSTLETILSPEPCHASQPLLIQNSWPTVSHLSEQVWPGTHLSLFDPNWEIKHYKLGYDILPESSHNAVARPELSSLVRRLDNDTSSSPGPR